MAAAVGAFALGAPSSAQACDLNNHCYGEIRWFPAQGDYTGALGFITTNNLTSVNSAHSTSEFWVCDYSSTGGCYSWMEEGQFVGARYNADIGGTGRAWFWAEYPNHSGSGCLGDFASHYANYPPWDTARHAVKISYNGGGKWAVYLDGTFHANTLTCHNYKLGNTSLGTEITENSAFVRGTGDSLQKRGADNVSWSYNWGGATLRQNPPAYASSSNPAAGLSYGAN